jgi:hypothetical protein
MPLLGLPWLVKIGIVAGLVAGLYGGYQLWRYNVWKSGWNDALVAVEKQNEQARATATGVRTKLRECEDRKGTWNVSTGECDP